MPKTKYIVREAEEKDLLAILEIMNFEILKGTAIYHYQQKSLVDLQNWYNLKKANKRPLLVVEMQNIVVGFGTFDTFRPFEGFQYTVEHSVYIHKQFRGLGFGKLLLKALISAAKKDKLHTMIAGIDAENKATISMHYHLGFREVGRFPQVGFKFENWLDLVFMQLILKDEI